MAKRKQTIQRAARKRKAAQKLKATRRAGRHNGPDADVSEVAAAGSGAAQGGTRTSGHAAAGAEAGSEPTKDIEAARESDHN